MNNLTDDFHILVEGEPNSPEVPFLNKLIQKIFAENKISILSRVTEVGGSTLFKSFAKFCYRDSEVHKTIPVLALSDNDYRTSLGKAQNQNSSLINKREPKIIYWQRHEWENYLLEETSSIASFINQLPNKTSAKTHKPFKQGLNTISKEEIDAELLKYFQEQLKNEFWECLKFNLSRNVKKRPSVKPPENFEKKELNEVRNWFLEETRKTEDIFELKEMSSNLFETITQEFKWESLFTSKHVTLEHAKKYFRGKEAFEHLFKFIGKKVELHNLAKKYLTTGILNIQVSNQFSIYSDLDNLLRTEIC